MLFNSPEFLFLFLPITLGIFIGLARSGNIETQINWLILASLVFYGSWNPYYVSLILLSLIINFFVGRRVKATEINSRLWLIIGVVFNLSLLGYFKYAGFFIENLNSLGLWLIPIPEIVLPLAISFFTFQQIAYLIDVARGECEEYEFRHYALFVLFFPQLIAGPIVHHREMMPQFQNLRSNKNLWPDLAVGLSIMAIGLFKKLVLADSVGQYADPVFFAATQDTPINALDAWIGTFAFSFQIYFDFSGYSDMAIGSARLFGIRLPENFRSPYKASSIIEIWRRWHMTLSRFLRDYLYITFGGNRHGSTRRYANLVMTMLLGGLWHGAAWTYVAWGAMHGFYLCVNHAWRAVCAKLGLEGLRTSPPLQPFYIFLTFIAWSLAFVVFRAADLKSAFAIITPGFTDFSGQSVPVLHQAITTSSLGQIFVSLGVDAGSYLPVYSLLALCAFVCWALPNTQQYMQAYDPVIGDGYATTRNRAGMQWQANWLGACVIAVLLSASLLSMSAITEFIYFQF